MNEEYDNKALAIYVKSQMASQSRFLKRELCIPPRLPLLSITTITTLEYGDSILWISLENIYLLVVGIKANTALFWKTISCIEKGKKLHKEE